MSLSDYEVRALWGTEGRSTYSDDPQDAFDTALEERRRGATFVRLLGPGSPRRQMYQWGTPPWPGPAHSDGPANGGSA